MDGRLARGQSNPTQTILAQAIALTGSGKAVVATDTLGTIVYWSDSAEHQFGWSRDDVLGRNVLDVAPSVAAQPEASAIFKGLRAGESWRGTLRLRRRDGTTFMAAITADAVYSDEGKLIGTAGVIEPVDT